MSLQRRDAPPLFLYEPKTLRSPDSIVHLEYDPENLDPISDSGWTRFVCISDTHARSFAVPDGDVLLHTGDLTNTGTLEEFETTIDWLCRLPHKVKIIVAGNHDLTLHDGWYDSNWSRWHRVVGKQSAAAIRKLFNSERAVAAGLVYLQDQQHTFQLKEGGRLWSVYGSPWSPMFFDWAFNYKRQNGPALVSKFPETDILLTHGPAFGIFDRTNGGDLAGCEALLSRLAELRPRIHLSGHIHEAHGAYVHDWTRDKSGNYAVPAVQNEEMLDSDSDADTVDEREPADSMGERREGDGREPNLLEGLKLDPGNVSRTVFVNAANWPSGRHAWRVTTADDHDKKKVPFGGPGFQAVVVDLRGDSSIR